MSSAEALRRSAPSALPPQRGAATVVDADRRARRVVAVLVCAALLALYGPTVHDLAGGLWRSDAQGHGPVVLAVAAWLFVRGLRQDAAAPAAPRPRPRTGGLLLAIAVLAYVLGRSQGLLALEVGSAVPLTLGGVLLLRGGATARRLWFAFFFLLFLVPLPGSVVDAVTQPLKIAVSHAAEQLLYWAGYPVARNGVVITIGPYQLLVADACAGLNSLFMLEAFGLLYLNVVRHESVLRNAVLAALIVPISFTANTLRVVLLALVSFHLGDEAGQGFLHSFSGMVLFVAALLLIVAGDSLARALARRGPGRRDLPATAGARPSPAAPPAAPLAAGATRHAAALLVLSLLAATGAWQLAPRLPAAAALPDLAAAIPTRFGDWTLVPTPYPQVNLAVATPGDNSTDRPYDQTVMRTYANAAGQQVMLAVAYGRNQRQEVKIHRPELCYAAQGYAVTAQRPASFSAIGGSSTPVTGRQLYAESARAHEAVAYWIRIGNLYSDSAWATRWHIVAEGLKGRVTDGVLVRASMLVRSGEEAESAQAQLSGFLRELVDATPEPARALLVR
ncbi:exosortase B [Methylibium sp.]|uniref:exosortase B n=1 Tax=Methylibium sp. TaxID=2067992 RepID=UPI003D147DE3